MNDLTPLVDLIEEQLWLNSTQPARKQAEVIATALVRRITLEQQLVLDNHKVMLETTLRTPPPPLHDRAAGLLERLHAVISADEDAFAQRIQDMADHDRAMQAAQERVDAEAGVTPIKARMVPPCPECAAGKHLNCTSYVLVEWTEEPQTCPCYELGHPTPEDVA